MMVSLGSLITYLDYVIYKGDCIAVLSLFERSQQVVKGFCAAATLYSGKEDMIIKGKRVKYTGKFDIYITPVTQGTEKYYHGVLINKEIGKGLMISYSQEQAGNDFYNLLMRKYDYPLIKWWGKYLLNKGLEEGVIKQYDNKTIVEWGKYGRLEDIDCLPELYDLRNYSQIHLERDIMNLFSENKIWITKKTQKEIDVITMDQYFELYGHSLIKNLESVIKPLTYLDGEARYFSTKEIRLYPQQIAMINGVIALLKKSNYAIINEGMGTGKTLQASCMCEGFIIKSLINQLRMSLRDIYSNIDTVHYRIIIMCPGHTVEKWKREILNQIPYTTVTVIKSLQTLIQLREAGSNRKGKEIFIMSKEFAKLSYMKQPVPTRIKYKKAVRNKICNNCNNVYLLPGGCPECDCKHYHLDDNVLQKNNGFICPECGELLLFSKIEDDTRVYGVLGPFDFSIPTARNSKCYYCGTDLWQPFVENINSVFSESNEKQPIWYRATHYKTRHIKKKKTVWVHRKYKDDYYVYVGEKPLNEKDDMKGCRKYSPSLFIKKYMKGFFDFAIFDEAHLYKGGATAQGNAMDALIKSSNKQLVLTGTIAGGIASDLFYLLYRLDPHRMREKGYRWQDVMKFVEEYGTIERTYELITNDTSQMNITSRGVQIGVPRAKPGISPLLFVDFLLDKAVFLDLTDMSKHLPDLNEYVVSVEPEQRILDDYQYVLQKLGQKIKKRDGKSLLGKRLQFALSYLDKPFGEEYIINPKNGSIVLEIPQNKEAWLNTMPKEKKLLEILQKELNEGRNCVVYAEYTRSPNTCVTQRLSSLIEQYIKVKCVVLESDSPEPLKREGWIRQQAENGVRVIITNPRCVETGIDLIWFKHGKVYNFPTLIFYQIGYSLFTVWQASYRAYRLNQIKECRTYYLCYQNSIQELVIQLIAEKKVATSAIQGKFSSNGLAAMAKGVDIRLKIAEALSHNDYQCIGIQEMFDATREANKQDHTYDGYDQMKLISELIGDETFEELEDLHQDKDGIGSFLEEFLDSI